MLDSPVALLLLLAAILAVPLLLRRLARPTPTSVRVLARTALTKNASVSLISIGRRRLLVGVGERGVNLITELDPDEVSGIGPGRSHGAIEDTDGTDAATCPNCADVNGSGDRHGGRWRTTTPGPRIGLLDRLRSLTVRTTPHDGRPIRVTTRR